MIIVTDPRNKSTQQVYARDHQCDSRRYGGNTSVISGARTYRIGTASWLDQASCIEADQVTFVANVTTTEEIVDR